ncbi:MAG TPA: tail fiber domain-containing protein, partial [candidate division Zixibacteria bacterium]|nr:tail fiber domain-containing protein [candidate division Zixibacteria bacterium]
VHTGSFVWSDSITVDFQSSAANQFNVRSSGGYRLYSDSGLNSGVTMGAGASSWTSVSDKSVKKDFRDINSDELLKRLSEIPISRWKYIAEESQADHIGPMSQDFYQAFGLGDDDKRISTIDADGVALAAIQALHKQNLELKKELENLKQQVQALSIK